MNTLFFKYIHLFLDDLQKFHKLLSRFTDLQFGLEKLKWTIVDHMCSSQIIPTESVWMRSKVVLYKTSVQNRLHSFCTLKVLLINQTKSFWDFKRFFCWKLDGATIFLHLKSTRSYTYFKLNTLFRLECMNWMNSVLRKFW